MLGSFAVVATLASIAPLAAQAPQTSSDSQRLTTTGSVKFSPVFGRDRQEIVFVQFDKPTQLQLMRLNLSDRSVQPLHKDSARHQFEPAFSPDGRYGAFIDSKGTLSLALVIRDLKENRDAELPPAPGFAGYRSPAFTADGNRVLYSFADGGRQQIYSVDLRGGDRKQLTNSAGLNNWPHASPDGKRIVFGSTRDGNFEIYDMNADGSDVRRLTHHPMQDLRPRYSPDGKRIAFTSNRDGNYEVYVMNADGSGLRRVTHNPERDDYAAWHPDGDRLVIVSERSGRQDLYLIPVP
jgi:Tol biopolymer transport system component